MYSSEPGHIPLSSCRHSEGHEQIEVCGMWTARVGTHLLAEGCLGVLCIHFQYIYALTVVLVLLWSPEICDYFCMS